MAMTAAVGLGDCEALHDGFLAQPANSLSSLAFLAVGVWVGARALAMDRGARWPGLALGAALVANGVGSAWYHGRPGEAGQWMHDGAALALPLIVLVVDCTLQNPRGSRIALPVLGAMLILVGAAEVASPEGTNQGMVSLLLVMIAAEVLVARNERQNGRPAWPPGHGVAKCVLGASLLVAGVGLALGRTGAAACRPASAWQFHALWHVAVAVAVGAYAVAVLEPRARAAFAPGVPRVGDTP